MACTTLTSAAVAHRCKHALDAGKHASYGVPRVCMTLLTDLPLRITVRRSKPAWLCQQFLGWRHVRYEHAHYTCN